MVVDVTTLFEINDAFINKVNQNILSYGQLGNGNKSNSCSPFRVAEDLGRVVEIAATLYNHISAATTQLSNKVCLKLSQR